MKKAGFTLLELILSLSIGIILLLVIVPSYQHLHARNKTTHLVNHITVAINSARSAAMAGNEVIIFCGSKDSIHCDGDWSHGQIIMAEQNQRVVDFFSEVMAAGDHLWWRSSLGTNNELKLSPSGFTEGQRGSFYYCPQYRSIDYGAKLVISDSARIRVEYGGQALQQTCSNFS